MSIGSGSRRARVRRLAASSLLLTCMLLPACRKRGPAGPVGPAASADSRLPATPLDVRLELHPRGAPHYVLRWAQPAGAVPVQAHLVYSSTAPLQVLDPGLVVAAAAGGADHAEVTLHGDTGLRHLRVTAVSVSGVEGHPSADLTVDTTGRVLFFAQPPADGTTIEDLYSQVPADPDSRANLTQLNGTETIVASRIAPDGRSVAVLADLENAGRPELFVVPIDGGASPVKVSGAIAGSVRTGFAWSPTGDRLAYAADSEASGVIEAFVAQRDAGSAPVKVSGAMVQGGGIDADFTAVQWSPDGHRLAYLAHQRDAQVQEAFVAVADASAPPVAVSGDLLAGSFVSEVAWSPEGRQLAFAAQRGTALHQLFVAPPDGSLQPEVRSGMLLDDDVRGLQWSPDGTRVAFLSARDRGLEVFVADAAEAMEPVPVDAGFPLEGITDSFAWSPDAIRLAFVASPDGESSSDLFVAPAAGGAIATMVGGSNFGDHDVQDILWSPDSAQVAFRARVVASSRIELFTTGPGFVSQPYRVSGDGGLVLQVASFDWSGEGERLSFRASTRNETEDLFVVNRFNITEPEPLPLTQSQLGGSAVAFPHLGSR